MFEILDERVKQDAAGETTKSERLLKWVAVVVFSVAVFGGLYVRMRLLE